jgi:outer membrane immunogenic protein
MKKFLLVGIAAAALYGAPATAAEMPLKAVADPPFNWTGWYGGGNTGYSWGDSRTTITSGNGTTPFDARIRHKGWEYSGEGGYCWQLTNATVDCIEIRYDGPREKGRITSTDPGGNTVEQTPRVPSTILIGPHLGMLTDMNHMLWYLAGGLALGESGASTIINGNALSTSEKWKAGWFLGAGVERMIDKHWSWKLEYDYVRFSGGVSATYPAGTIFIPRGTYVNPVTVNSNKDTYDNKISFGINYHFGSN